MKKLLINCAVATLVILLGSSQAYANKVISGSKYPITISTWQGSCDDEKSTFSKMFDEMTKVDKGALSKFKATLNQATSPKCTQVKSFETLKPGKSTDVAPGQLIVAFKPTKNPFPAICTVPADKDVRLVTRKSETLRGLFGKAGDGGLTCEFE